MIRRHEKDYIIRGKEKYIDQTYKKLEILGASIESSSLSEIKKQNFKQMLRKYRTDFTAMINIDKKLTTSQQKILEKSSLVLNQIAEILKYQEHKVDQTVTNISNRVDFLQKTLWLISIITIVIGILVSIFLSKLITRPIKNLVNLIIDIAQKEGDLTKRLQVRGEDETGKMAYWFNRFIGKIQDIIKEVRNTIITVLQSADEVTILSKDLETIGNEQLQQSDLVTKHLNEIFETIDESNRNAKNSLEMAKATKEITKKAETVMASSITGMEKIKTAMDETRQKMASLETSVGEINKVIGLITEIADQTNLLALNAAIEAARAGSNGRGFAVVADEVRKLSEKTSSATNEIVNLIKMIRAETTAAQSTLNDTNLVIGQEVETVKAAEKDLTEISVSILNEIKDIEMIAESMKILHENSQSIMRQIDTMNRKTNQSSESAKSMGQHGIDLINKINLLEQLIERFKI